MQIYDKFYYICEILIVIYINMGSQLSDFNPNGVGIVGSGFFSLPCDVESSMLAILSAPWDVTVSYGAGSAAAPAALCEASSQIDLYDDFAYNVWREGIATLPISDEIAQLSEQLRPAAVRIIDHLEGGGDLHDQAIAADLEAVNGGSRTLNDYIYNTSRQLLEQGKLIALVGGDHSTPYSLIKALGEHHSDLGVLHIDAHRDLREAYEGFDFSHASVMYNVLRDIPSVSRLVQVGVRDFCDAEQAIAESDDRVVSFSDMALARARFEGERWGEQCRRIVESLPQNVYISFDIDGLDISCCPHTGTPVPGGLSYREAIYLMERVVESGRTIVGCDVVEVVPNADESVDLAVGVRILYKLCCLTIKSN